MLTAGVVNLNGGYLEVDSDSSVTASGSSGGFAEGHLSRVLVAQTGHLDFTTGAFMTVDSSSSISADGSGAQIMYGSLTRGTVAGTLALSSDAQFSIQATASFTLNGGQYTQDATSTTMVNGSFFLADSGAVLTAGVVNLNGGYLDVDSTSSLTASGSSAQILEGHAGLSNTRGRIEVLQARNMYVDPTSTFDLTGAFSDDSSSEFDDAGSTVLGSGATFQDAGLATVEQGADLQVQAGAMVTNDGNLDVNGTFEDGGSYVAVSGGVSSGIPVLSQQAGSINITGTVTVEQGGDFQTQAGASVTNDGNLDVNGTFEDGGSYVAVSGGVSGEIPVLSQQAGSINITGTVTVEQGGDFQTQAGASVTNDGNLDVNGTFEDGGSYVAVSGGVSSGIPVLSQQAGSINITGTVTVEQGGDFQTQAGASVTNDGNLDVNGTLENAGTVVASSGSGSSGEPVLSQPAGSILINGTVTDQSTGDIQVQSGATVTNDGNLDVNGTLENAGTVVAISSGSGGGGEPVLSQPAGSINVTGTVTVQQDGNVQLNNGGDLNDDGGQVDVAQGGTLDDGDSIQLTNGATLDVSFGGKLLEAGDFTSSASSTLDIAGSLTVQSGGSLTGDSAVTVEGVLEVDLGGTLDLQGTLTLAAGAELIVGGSVTLPQFTPPAGFTFNFPITSAVAGTGYQTLTPSGTLNLNDSDLSVSLGFTLKFTRNILPSRDRRSVSLRDCIFFHRSAVTPPGHKLANLCGCARSFPSLCTLVVFAITYQTTAPLLTTRPS